MLDPNRPIYRDTPLKLVTFQVKFPNVPDLEGPNPPRGLAEALRERFPILGAPPFLQVEFSGGASRQRQMGSRLTNRDRTWTVTLTNDAVAVETSSYERYEHFAAHVSWVLERVHTAISIPAVTRVGLRYIDEIEIEGLETLEDWRPWIRADLLAGGVVEGYRTRDYLVQVLLEVDELRRIGLRYGRVSQPVVDSNGPLKIKNSPSSPYFLLDIDSFWEPSTDEFREFNADEVREMSLALHEPVRDIFERAITSDLRARFGPEGPA